MFMLCIGLPIYIFFTFFIFNFVHTSYPYHACYLPTHPALFYCLNTIFWRLQVTSLSVMQLPSPGKHSLSLRSQYFTQQFVIKFMSLVPHTGTKFYTHKVREVPVLQFYTSVFPLSYSQRKDKHEFKTLMYFGIYFWFVTLVLTHISFVTFWRHLSHREDCSPAIYFSVTSWRQVIG